MGNGNCYQGGDGDDGGDGLLQSKDCRDLGDHQILLKMFRIASEKTN